MSSPQWYIMVDTVDGVGVKVWTCSGFVCNLSLQNLDSSLMSSSVQPGWAAMK